MGCYYHPTKEGSVVAMHITLRATFEQDGRKRTIKREVPEPLPAFMQHFNMHYELGEFVHDVLEAVEMRDGRLQSKEAATVDQAESMST